MDKEIYDEAYRQFPDVIEPVEVKNYILGCEPADGVTKLDKIVVDNGNIRFAFCCGARFQKDLTNKSDKLI